MELVWFKALTVGEWMIGTLRNISPLPAAMNASSIDIDRTIALPLITPLLSYSLQDAVSEVQTTLAEPVRAPFSFFQSASPHYMTCVLASTTTKLLAKECQTP